jgi:hypothetical protein
VPGPEPACNRTAHSRLWQSYSVLEILFANRNFALRFYWRWVGLRSFPAFCEGGSRIRSDRQCVAGYNGTTREISDARPDQRLPFSSGREGSIEYYPEIDLIVCLEASLLDQRYNKLEALLRISANFATIICEVAGISEQDCPERLYDASRLLFLLSPPSRSNITYAIFLLSLLS